tara:strand:- start:86 stop:1219 length:1134 start_codon:yes stop_codon:yes gene_type:complete
MHPEAGRARAYAQGQDDPEVIMEAIDTCPVNCISFVDLEDLVILEQERDDQVINQAAIGVPATWSVRINAMPPTKAKLGGGGALTCCSNCPSKGCKECPMYGVGLNPIYMDRMEARQAKKEASGQAQKEREDEARAESVSAIFADAGYGLGDDDFDEGYMTMPPLEGVVVPTTEQNQDAPSGAGGAAPGNDVFAAIFGDEDDGLGEESAQRQAAMAAPEGLVADAARRVAAEQARLAVEARAEEERAREAERRAVEEAARRAAEEAERAERAHVQAEKAEAARRAMEAREAAEAALAALTEFDEHFRPVGGWEEKWRWAMSKDKRLGAIADLAGAQAALEEASDRAEQLGVKAYVVRAARSRAKALDADRKVLEAAL